MCEKYNGYTNYPTWVVALWQDNDEGSYEHARSLAYDILDNNGVLDQDPESSDFGFSTSIIHDLADMLKDNLNEFNPVADDANVFNDLMSWSLGHVNWYEIAENLIEAEIDNL